MDDVPVTAQGINNSPPVQNTQSSGITPGFLLRVSNFLGISLGAAINALSIDNLSRRQPNDEVELN